MWTRECQIDHVVRKLVDPERVGRNPLRLASEFLAIWFLGEIL
jgi:hypothetical protein